MGEPKEKSLFWLTYGRETKKKESDLSQFSDESLTDFAEEQFGGEE